MAKRANKPAPREITVPVTSRDGFPGFYQGGTLEDPKTGKAVAEFGVSLGGGTIYLFRDGGIGYDAVFLKDVVLAMHQLRLEGR